MTTIENKVRGWIRKNVKENSRLEFKLRIALDNAGAKAELIRDVISLANSEGEFPRTEGYLVLGFKDGRRHNVAVEHYDGATFGQILDSHVYPPISTEYLEFGAKAQVGVLVVKGDVDTLHVVSKKFSDENNKTLLSPGQSWGRRSDQKVALDGPSIHSRHQSILDRRLADANAPLHARIHKLESDAGPALQVKQLRFAIESTQDWSAVDDLLTKLHPYVRELLGDTRPAAVHYRLTAGNTGFYAEFLTPLIGSVHKRGRRDATVSIAGVSAQKLRYLELLLAAPWKVEVSPATGSLQSFGGWMTDGNSPILASLCAISSRTHLKEFVIMDRPRLLTHWLPF
jgi:hypothetical protein